MSVTQKHRTHRAVYKNPHTQNGLKVFIFCIQLIAISGCVPWGAMLSYVRGSVHSVTSGVLNNPALLNDAQSSYRFYRPDVEHHGTAGLVDLVTRTAQRLSKQADTARLQVGDLSNATGGFLSGHKSHRTGRDVDFAFFTTDASGHIDRPVPLVEFNRFGVGIKDHRVYRFDLKRNWLLVEILLSDPEIDVQWIFVSNGLKAQLLNWASQNGRDINIIGRAAQILHQPKDAAWHNDHFHVRIYCPTSPPDEQHCTDTKPMWPWKPKPAPRDTYTDDDIVRLALDSIERE